MPPISPILKEQLLEEKALLEEKLGFFRQEEATAVDVNAKFSIKKEIEKTEARITEIQAQLSQSTSSGSQENQEPVFNYYHRYTCDRVEQNDAFHELFDNKKNKVHYFYLVGQDMNSHEGIFNRFGYDLEGKLLDYLNPNLDSETRSLKIDLTIEPSRIPKKYYENILKSFFAGLAVPPDLETDLSSKTLSYLCEKSPEIQGLTSNDFICVFLGIEEDDWDKDLVTEVAAKFIDDFCECNLPKTAPTFLFFFGIKFEDHLDPQTLKEVREALTASSKVFELPELTMIKDSDIKSWFNRYKKFFGKDRDRKNTLKELLGKLEEYKEESGYFMEDIETELETLINQINEKFIKG